MFSVYITTNTFTNCKARWWRGYDFDLFAATVIESNINSSESNVWKSIQQLMLGPNSSKSRIERLKNKESSCCNDFSVLKSRPQPNKNDVMRPQGCFE